MPPIKIQMEWYGRKPKGAPTEIVTVWPRQIETPEEERTFKAAICEYMDDEYSEQPKSIAWGYVSATAGG